MQQNNEQNRITMPSYYANFATVNTTVFDFMVMFGVRRGEEVMPAGELIMSPQHAKAFAKLLTKHVEEYEEKMGEIKTELDEDGNRIVQ